MNIVNITDYRATPWEATHIVYQYGSGNLRVPVPADKLCIAEITDVELINRKLNLAYPFRVVTKQALPELPDLPYTVTVTQGGCEFEDLLVGGWWCVKLDDEQLRAVENSLKPPEPEPVKKKDKKDRLPVFSDFKIGQQVRIGDKSILCNNKFGTVLEDAGLLGEVIELLEGRQGVKVLVKPEGRSPTRYVYEPHQLVLLDAKAKVKKKKDFSLDALIAKRMSKLKPGDKVFILGDVCERLPGTLSGWTESMYEQIGKVLEFEGSFSASHIRAGSHIYHVLDVIKV